MKEYQNKYQDAYDRIYVATNGGDGLAWELNRIYELITMHTEPLKQEEIKEGMFVWDSKYEAYAEVDIVDDNELYMSILGHFYQIEQFEEGRFYRYQPLE